MLGMFTVFTYLSVFLFGYRHTVPIYFQILLIICPYKSHGDFSLKKTSINHVTKWAGFFPLTRYILLQFCIYCIAYIYTHCSSIGLRWMFGIPSRSKNIYFDCPISFTEPKPEHTEQTLYPLQSNILYNNFCVGALYI